MSLALLRARLSKLGGCKYDQTWFKDETQAADQGDPKMTQKLPHNGLINAVVNSLIVR